MSNISVIHGVRVVIFVMIWACCWNHFARWIAHKIAIEESIVVKLKYRVLLWAMLFEAVILIGVVL